MSDDGFDAGLATEASPMKQSLIPFLSGVTTGAASTGVSAVVDIRHRRRHIQ